VVSGTGQQGLALEVEGALVVWVPEELPQLTMATLMAR